MLEKRRLAQRGTSRVVVLLVGFMLVLGACGGAASPAPSSAPAASEAAVASPTAAPAITAPPIDTTAPGPNGGVVVRWFVGLGAGGQPQQLQTEAEFVDAYNKSQKDVYIALEIYNNNVAANILKTQIAAGNAPDIIGPVGVEGLNLFRDQLLDLQPLIDKTGYKVDGVDPKLVDFFKLGEGGATIGVPFATYPSYLYFNKDLFDEAGLPYPPTKVGDKYQGKDWDMAAVRELGMKLTVDKAGNDATSPDFDAKNVVQWGFDMQYADNSPLAEASPVRRQLVPRRRRQDRPDPGLDPDRREVVQRRRLEGPLHPQRGPDQQRPARQGQRVRVGQPGDERVAQLVHLLRLPGGARRAQGQAVRLRDRAVLQRQDHAPSSTPTPSACSSRPRSRMRPSRP